jgi:hypothetical protein
MEVIGKYAFYNCSGPEKIEVNAKYIKDSALYMKNVKEVIIGSYTREISSNGLPAQSESIILEEGVTILRSNALGYVSKEIHLPNSLEIVESVRISSESVYYNGTFLELINSKYDGLYLSGSSYVYMKNRR